MNEKLYYKTYSSPLGIIHLLAIKDALSSLMFDSQLPPSFNKESYERDNSLSLWNTVFDYLDLYFQSKPLPALPPLHLEGTPFQKVVWEQLLAIPYGERRKYGEIARLVGVKMNKPKMSAQAIGQAVSANPICVIVPCHRVVASGNKIGGYSGGIHIKQTLLALEGVKY